MKPAKRQPASINMENAIKARAKGKSKQIPTDAATFLAAHADPSVREAGATLSGFITDLMRVAHDIKAISERLEKERNEARAELETLT